MRQGSSQETPAVVQQRGDQGLNWGRETVEMEKDGHMGEIKRKDSVSGRDYGAFPHGRGFFVYFCFCFFATPWHVGS